MDPVKNDLSDNKVQIVNNILYGPRMNYEPYSKGMGAFMYETCQRYPEKICQICAETGVTETYGSVKMRSVRMAMEMSRRGISQGDIITVCSYNTMNSQIPAIASLFLGVKVSSLDPTLSKTDVDHLLSLVNPKMIFACPDGKKLVDSVLNANKCLSSEVVLLEGEQFSKFQSKTPKEEEFRPVQVDAKKTVAFIMFSSGTTGLPKGIEVTHYGIDYGAAVMKLSGLKTDSLLHITSLYWISAVLILQLKFQTVGRTVIFKCLDPKTIFRVLQDCKVTFAFLASTLAYCMTSDPEASKYDFSHVHCLIFSGSTVPEEQLVKLKHIFKNTYTNGGYGMTELTSFATMFRLGLEDHLIETKRKSVGTPCFGMKIKVVDQLHNTLGPNQQGEIHICAKSMMLGYHKMEADVFDCEGFLKTGDVGYYDDDGCVYIVDRLKDMFKYKDWHIVPASIETVLLQHPGISDAAVFGIPYPEVGYIPSAAVVLKNGFGHVTEEDICEFVIARVADRQRLRGGIKFIDKMPRTPTGKILRRKFRDTFQIVVKD